VNYVLRSCKPPDGNLYGAAGGAALRDQPDGSSACCSIPTRTTCCAHLRRQDLLYVGTDPHGLVYRVNRKTGDSFVLTTPRVGDQRAGAVQRRQTSTPRPAEAKEHRPARAKCGRREKSGRPKAARWGFRFPSDRRRRPTPPAPAPNPGRPDPIPKEPQSRARKKRAANGYRLLPYSFAKDRVAVWGRGWFGAGRNLIVTRASPVLSAQNNSELHSTEFETSRTGGRPSQLRPTERRFSSLREHQRRGRADWPKSPGKPGPLPDRRRPRSNPGPGKPQPGRKSPREDRPAEPPLHQAAVDTTIPPSRAPEGNAIYKIDPDGFVTQVFRQPVLNSFVWSKTRTSWSPRRRRRARFYQVRPSPMKNSLLAKVVPRPSSVSCPPDGKVYMAMANRREPPPP